MDNMDKKLDLRFSVNGEILEANSWRELFSKVSSVIKDLGFGDFGSWEDASIWITGGDLSEESAEHGIQTLFLFLEENEIDYRFVSEY